MMAMSSTQVATCGNNSLTSAPDCPYFLKVKGEPRILSLMLKTVVGGLNGSDWPLSLISRGLGSKVSICDGPPSMNRKITDFAFGAKCGVTGLAAADFSERSPVSAKAPNPFAHRLSISRRLTGPRQAEPPVPPVFLRLT